MGVYCRQTKDSKKIWWIDFYVEGRRVREKIGESKMLARKVLEKRKGEVVTGKFKLKDTIKAPGFDKFTDNYLEWAKLNKKSWKRDRDSIGHLKAYFGARRLSEITPWLIEKYKYDRIHAIGVRSTHPAPGTINRELSCLKTIYSKAIKWGKALENPTKSVKLLKEKPAGRRLTFDEQQALLAACSENLKPIVIFALQTGRRESEILNLKWKDVNMNTWQITFQETKAGESQTVPINSIVQKLLNELPKCSEWIFTNSNGSHRKDIRRAWLNAVEKSGIGHCRFHDLRHTWASQMGEYTDLKTLMELGGWKRPQIPMRYVHPSSDHKRECLEKLVKSSHNMVTRAKLVSFGG